MIVGAALRGRPFFLGPAFTTRGGHGGPPLQLHCANARAAYDSEEAGEAFDPSLTKAEASKRIEELQQKTGRGIDH